MIRFRREPVFGIAFSLLCGCVVLTPIDDVKPSTDAGTGGGKDAGNAGGSERDAEGNGGLGGATRDSALSDAWGAGGAGGFAAPESGAEGGVGEAGGLSDADDSGRGGLDASEEAPRGNGGVLGGGGANVAYDASTGSEAGAGGQSTGDQDGATSDAADTGPGQKGLGQSCGTNGECSSGRCVDGVCCTNTSCPACMNCGSSGLCDVPVKSRPDMTGSTCSGTQACSSDGTCKLALGQACSEPLGCASGFCLDGVCCDSPCNGTCLTCNPSGTGCVAVTLREHPTCRTDATGVRMCDALGACSTPHLLMDVNPVLSPGTTNSGPSMPRGFTQGPDHRVYFSANDGTRGDELWVTDGTADHTSLVADLDSGAGNSNPSNFTVLGDKLIFTASPLGNAQLYVTNGTSLGTFPVAAWASNSGPPRAMGNYVYFSGCDGAHGCELWRSDGTVGGTQLVKDIMTAPLTSDPTKTHGSSPQALTAVGNMLFFKAADYVPTGSSTPGNYELWRSDGTPAGTVLVQDIEPGFGSSDPSGLAAIPTPNGPRLAFTALRSNNTANQELYVTNGTTVDVIDLTPSEISGSTPQNITVMNNRAYFTASDSGAGRELWTTNGSAGGTYRVADIFPGVNGSNPRLLTPSPKGLFFVASSGSGPALWVSNGTAGDAHIVNSALGTAFQMAYFGAWMYVTTAGSGSNELWVTDGSLGGTFKACPDPSKACGDVFPGHPSDLAVAGDRLYFNAQAVRRSGTDLSLEPFVFP